MHAVQAPYLLASCGRIKKLSYFIYSSSVFLILCVSGDIFELCKAIDPLTNCPMSSEIS